jgi:hypothetical protein
MKLRTEKVSKGIAFAGCSFTWGQGLWYYSNLPSVIEQPLNSYDQNLVHFSHRKAAHRLRFARIVADHFDTWEVAHYKNGGNINAITEYWRNHAFQEGDLRLLGREQDPTYRSYDPRDIGYFILQCTQPSRSVSNIKLQTAELLQRWQLFEQYPNELKEYLNSQQLTVDQYMDQCKQDDVAAYRSLLEYIESLGIKTLIMSWPDNLLKNIGLDEWLSSKLIKFDYLGTTYNSIERLIDANPGMTLSTDYQNFETPPTDDHPSLLCHRVIAQGVIEK